jgi:hypothetical protein
MINTIQHVDEAELEEHTANIAESITARSGSYIAIQFGDELSGQVVMKVQERDRKDMVGVLTTLLADLKAGVH